MAGNGGFDQSGEIGNRQPGNRIPNTGSKLGQ